MGKDIIRSIIKTGAVITGLILITGCADNQAAHMNGQQESAEVIAETVEPAAETSEKPAEAKTEDTEESVEDDGAFRADNSFVEEYESFAVTSESLHDGVWDDVISNTASGSNRSPQLSWEPVEGAQQYIIYMSDLGAWNWIHWKSGEVTETDLPEGWAPGSDYKGPYPPAGATHTYEVYVIAIRKPVERVKGGLDSQNPRFEENFRAADTDAEGNTGNIIGVGHISGTFTGK